MPRTSSLPLISSVDLYKQESIASTDLGQLLTTQDGRKFRYSLIGASNLVAGNVIQAKAVDTQFNTLAVAVATLIGDTTVTVTNGTTTIAANDYKDGIAVVESSTGIGQMSRILSHTTGTSGQSITLTLEDPFQVALTTSSKITMRSNPWFKVVQAAGPVTAAAVGGAVALNVAATYGYLQTGGWGAVLSDATVTAAATMGMSPSAGTAGAATKAVSQDQYLGRSLNPVSISAKVEPFMWQLD